ncbi:MAG TPA: hypothetical protein VEC36_03550 [Patescibacteria group bacterium]|nr:hypothetical protein [Patescibacteria group bacterium]
MNYAQIFKKNPNEIIQALNAIEQVTDELSRASMSERVRQKWDIIHKHLLKTCAICWLLERKSGK